MIAPPSFAGKCASKDLLGPFITRTLGVFRRRLLSVKSNSSKRDYSRF